MKPLLDFKPAPDIVVSPATDRLGPYEFDLDGWLPSGRKVSAVTALSYLNGKETTAKLIEPGSAEAASATSVRIKLQYPGQEYHGRHRLVLAVTMDDESIDEAHFTGIVVRGRD